MLEQNPTQRFEEEKPAALQNRELQDIFCIWLYAHPWGRFPPDIQKLEKPYLFLFLAPWHHHLLPYLGNPDLHPLLLGTARTSFLLHFLFQMLILLCLLGSSLGAPQSYFFPSYSTYPTYNTFLGSGSFPRYYGAAAIPRTGFSYSFGPGYNFQWRYKIIAQLVSCWLTLAFAEILAKLWTFCHLWPLHKKKKRLKWQPRKWPSRGEDDSQFPFSSTCIISIFTSRFDTRPAPASPEEQVLVRQEESSATATNSEISIKCHLLNCSFESVASCQRLPCFQGFVDHPRFPREVSRSHSQYLFSVPSL